MASGSSRVSTCISRYLQEIREYPVLTREDEIAAARRLHGAAAGPPDFQDLVKSNLAFVVKIASEYRNMGLSFEDLLSEGNVGVIEAARHFDPNRGTRFLTYAVWWIRKAMLKAIAEQAFLVPLPAYQLKKLRSVTNAGHQLSRELGREADREEISKELRLSIARIDAILALKPREVSLDDKVGRETDAPISDYLTDERSPNPEDELIRHESQELIRWALGSLSDQERAVIINRFGLGGGRARTLREVGAMYGVSRERIRQLETQAIKRIKKAISRRLHGPASSRPPSLRKRRDLPRSSGAMERCGRAAGSPAMYALRARARSAASSGQAGTVFV